MHTLEAHAEQLLRNPAVMNTTWPELQGKLAREATYVSAFRAAYVDGLTWNNVIAALVSFERSLTTPHSRFDTYLRGERQALTTQERAHSKPGTNLNQKERGREQEPSKTVAYHIGFAGQLFLSDRQGRGIHCRW